MLQKKTRVVIYVDLFTRYLNYGLRNSGPKSGQEFRETLLSPALSQFDYVEIDFSGVFSVSSRFLEEAFTKLNLPYLDLLERVKILNIPDSYKNEIDDYLLCNDNPNLVTVKACLVRSRRALRTVEGISDESGVCVGDVYTFLVKQLKHRVILWKQRTPEGSLVFLCKDKIHLLTFWQKVLFYFS